MILSFSPCVLVKVKKVKIENWNDHDCYIATSLNNNTLVSIDRYVVVFYPYIIYKVNGCLKVKYTNTDSYSLFNKECRLPQ